MNRILILALALALCLAGGAPATADVFDKINGFFDKVNSKLEPLSGDAARTPDFNPNAGTVAESRASTTYSGGYVYGTDPTGTPETGFSLKALEAMAALGDKWARLKLEELQAKRFMEYQKAVYDNISWFNIFRKVGAWSDYRGAKKYYERAAEMTARYEKENPGSGGAGIITGIDSINETVLEVKALFGDKKAKAQLELLRAKREYDRLQLEYNRAGFFDKMKIKNDLDYAKKRYELAVINYQSVMGGKAPVYSTSQIDPIYKNTANPGTTSTVASNNNAAVSFAKDRMEAAYKRYTAYLSTSNPDPQKLQLLKMEYEMTLQELNRLQGR